MQAFLLRRFYSKKADDKRKFIDRFFTYTLMKFHVRHPKTMKKLSMVLWVLWVHTNSRAYERHYEFGRSPSAKSVGLFERIPRNDKDRKNVIRIRVFRVHNRYSGGEQRSSSEFDGEKLPNQKYIRLKSFRRKSFYWDNFSFATIHCRSSLYPQTPSNFPIRDITNLMFLNWRRFTTNIFPVVRPWFFLPMCFCTWSDRDQKLAYAKLSPSPLIVVTMSNRNRNCTFNLRLFATKFW